jgi:hypothetical protein
VILCFLCVDHLFHTANFQLFCIAKFMLEHAGIDSTHYSLEKMLPFFAASDHNLYLKSVYCHLQQMDTLENDHLTSIRSFARDTMS